jgi:quinolinate synthase
MAETIAILAADHQSVYITNPKAGCTLEMMAKDHMVRPVVASLRERYGDELLIVAYVNTSGRIKALAGESGGATCTSANALPVLAWALAQGRKVLFIPDRNLGENTAAQLSVPSESIYLWPGGDQALDVDFDSLPCTELERLDRAALIVWGGFCRVHTIFKVDHVQHWRERDYSVLVHPECPREIVAKADGAGSTSYLWNYVMASEPGSRFAIGTDGHFVQNLREQAAELGIEVVHLAATPGAGLAGCACATMTRCDPPHLAGTLDLLRQGKLPEANRVVPGDCVEERSGLRERLPAGERETLVRHARRALGQMMEITETPG